MHPGVRRGVGWNPSSSGWRTKANQFQFMTFDLLIHSTGLIMVGTAVLG